MSSFKINKNAGHEFATSERVDWLDRFADDLEKQKSAVEVARERSQQSVYDQITSIVSGNKTHASVDDKIQDLQERVGLKEYLRRISSQDEQTKTAANELNEVLESTDEELKEKIAHFIKNKIKTYLGHISVHAMQVEVLSAFKSGVKPQEINDPRVATIIKAMIDEEKARNPSSVSDDQNIGLGVGVELEDDDGANSDWMSALMPNNKDS